MLKSLQPVTSASSSTEPTRLDSQESVEQWLRKLSKKLQTPLHYSPRLHKVLLNRMYYLRHVISRLKGGRQKEHFFAKTWSFTCEPDEIRVSHQELLKVNAQLHGTITELNQRVSDQAQFIKKLQTSEAGHGTQHHRGQKRHLEGYSERHKRRLKKQRTKSCNLSLGWLEKEGLTPTKVR